jgi:hypothetical protein
MKGFLPRSAIRSLWGTALATLVLLTARAASAQAIIDVVGNFGDGRTRMLSQTANGAATIRVLAPNGAVEANVTYGPFPGWTIRALAPSANNGSRLLWTHVDGRASFWTLAPDGNFVSGFEESARATPTGQIGEAIDLADDARGRLCFVFADPRGIAQVTVVDEAGVLAPAGTRVVRSYGPYPGWRPVAVAAGPSRTFALLWRHNDGRASVWRLEAFGGFISGAEFGPFPGWTPTDVSIGGDDNSRLLWAHTNGSPPYGWLMRRALSCSGENTVPSPVGRRAPSPPVWTASHA